MRPRLLLSSFVLLALAVVARADGPRAEAPIQAEDPSGDPPPPDGRFRILHVHRDQKLALVAPWHAPGGDWTFFDCAEVDVPAATFLLGYRKGPVVEGTLSGEGALVATSPEAGAALLARLARASKAPVPRQPWHQPLALRRHRIVIQGEGLRRRSPLEYEHGGGWVVSRWSLSEKPHEGWLWVNMDVEGGVGELRFESGSDGILAALAIALRDGPRPARTPANDPRLTDGGPHLADWRSLGSAAARGYGFVGRFYVFTERGSGHGRIVNVLDPEKGQVRELVRLEGHLGELRCAGAEVASCLVTEAVTTDEEHELALDAPERVWWLDGGVRKELKGEWRARDLLLPDEAIAPGAQFVAVVSTAGERGKDDHRDVVHFVDLERGGVRSVDMGDLWANVIRWEPGPVPRAVVVVGDPSMGGEKRRRWIVDPRTGAKTRAGRPPRWVGETSPDGRWTALPRGDRLVLRSAKGAERTFRFHPDDLEFSELCCTEWVGPHYLLFETDRLALIDAERLEMSYLTGPGERPSLHWSPDFRWVVENLDEGGLRIGRVVVP